MEGTCGRGVVGVKCGLMLVGPLLGVIRGVGPAGYPSDGFSAPDDIIEYSSSEKLVL